MTRLRKKVQSNKSNILSFLSYYLMYAMDDSESKIKSWLWMDEEVLQNGRKADRYIGWPKKTSRTLNVYRTKLA